MQHGSACFFQNRFFNPMYFMSEHFHQRVIAKQVLIHRCFIHIWTWKLHLDKHTCFFKCCESAMQDARMREIQALWKCMHDIIYHNGVFANFKPVFEITYICFFHFLDLDNASCKKLRLSQMTKDLHQEGKEWAQWTKLMKLLDASLKLMSLFTCWRAS